MTRAPTRRALLAGALAALLATVAACGEDPITNEPPHPVGSHSDKGPIKLRNVYLAQPAGGRYEPGQDTVGFLTITTTAERRDRLVSVNSPVAKRIELRWDRDCDGDPQHVDALPLLPEGTVPEANRGGATGHAPYFLHVVGLTKSIPAGTTVPVSFEFARAGEVTMPVKVHGRHPSDVRSEFACGVDPASLVAGG
ncbi:copper chaperone PCu(A)C [Haloechinothrix halophila]|uniref:copper chaperone PCu(A)C n=1 Tax=Haloechinothrix halophila TaxID=1069073 RepID=UPI0004101A22|nr:copper chaperone PCu(A)C [Haloechinothrix halophila]